MLVVTRPDLTGGNEEEVVIRDTLHEFLELVPSVPKLQVLDVLLRGQQYDDGHDDEVMEDTRDEDDMPVSLLLA